MTVEAATPLGLVRLTAAFERHPRLRAMAGAALGMALPEPGRLSGAGPHAVWESPSDILVITAPQAAAGLAARLRAALAAETALATDVSASLAAFDLAGPDARPLLGAAAIFDLSDRAFPPGAATLLRFAGLRVHLLALAADRLRLLCDRSAAPYLAAFLASRAEHARVA